MKRRAVTVFICFSMSFLCLAGCEKTPEGSIVREKGVDNTKKYESGENADDLLRKQLNAPEHYKNEASYENGGLIIDTDADVIVPEVSAVHTYEVTAKEVNQDLIDTVTNVFFEGETVYHAFSYGEWTKDDYQERITLLKKYKAEGNLDPYHFGKDENGNYYFNIDDEIAKSEEAIQSAPDERKKEAVTPAFGLEYSTGKEQLKEKDENHFGGVVESSDGIYDYEISYSMKPDVKFLITKKKNDLADPLEFTSWTEGEYVMNNFNESYISEEVIQDKLNISLENAQKIAEEKIEKLGWDLKVYDWDYSVFCHGEEGVREENMLDAGYLFYFSRELEGVPITHTASYGGSLEDMDSTLVPWSYERCSVIVGDDGIQQVEIYNPYDIGKMQTENVKLMDFDQIAEIYEQMMEVSNADITNYEANRKYHIRKIVLGYTRIYDPTKNNEQGMLVPAWDFFGAFDSKDLEGNLLAQNSGERSTQSHMTINAIDGTVIDRGLGY